MPRRRLGLLGTLAPFLSLGLLACVDASSRPCGEGFCRPGLVCSAELECVPPGSYCGDGHIDPGETCDDGQRNDDTVPGACRSDCQPGRCGDGVLDPGELPVCLRAAGAYQLDLPPSRDVTAHARLFGLPGDSTRPPFAVASVDGGTILEVVTWEAGTSSTSLVSMPDPITSGTFWDDGGGNQLLVFGPGGEVYRVAKKDVGLWQWLEKVDFGVVGVIDVQSQVNNVLVATGSKIMFGKLMPDPQSEFSHWQPRASIDVTGGNVLAAHFGQIAGKTAVAALVDTLPGRQLRIYGCEPLAPTCTLAATLPLAAQDQLLEFNVGVTGTSEPNEVALVFADRIEIRDSMLALLHSQPWTTTLAWARTSRVASSGHDIVVGGAASGLWAAELAPAPLDPPPATGPVEITIARLDSDGSASDAVLADVDRDGWPELMRRLSDKLAVQRAGDGAWSSPIRSDVALLPQTAGDVDGNGKSDLLGFNKEDESIAWVEVGSDRQFLSGFNFRLRADTVALQQALTCDTDGDGHDELIVEYTDADTTGVVAVRPTTDPEQPAEALWSFQTTKVGSFTAADLEHDGACDVIFVEEGGQARLFPGTRGSGLGAEVDLGQLTGVTTVERVQALPVADGDVLVAVSSADVVAWTRGASLRAGGEWSYRHFFGVESTLTGHFTDDAVAGILAVDSVGALVWKELGDAFPVTLDASLGLAPGGAILAAGDVNADGLTDVVIGGGAGATLLLARDHHAPAGLRFSPQPDHSQDGTGILVDLDRDGCADWVAVGFRSLLVRYGQPGLAAQRAAAARSRSTSSARSAR